MNIFFHVVLTKYKEMKKDEENTTEEISRLNITGLRWPQHVQTVYISQVRQRFANFVFSSSVHKSRGILR